MKKHLLFLALTAFVALTAISSHGIASGIPNLQPDQKQQTYTLSFYNTHTNKSLTVTYKKGTQYDQAAIHTVNQYLRDHRNGHVHEINSELLDLLSDIKIELEARHPGKKIVYHVISGYRSPETNEMLRRTRGGQAKNSRHMHGDAIDIRVPGIDLVELRNVAYCMKRGGVGYYTGNQFVHVDTWKVRHWNWNPSGVSCSKYTS